jgi:hypothetical protein
MLNDSSQRAIPRRLPLKVKPIGIGRKEDALTILGLIKIELTVYGAANHHDT